MMKLGVCKTTGLIWEENGSSEVVQILILYNKSLIKLIRFLYANRVGVHHSKLYGVPKVTLCSSIFFSIGSSYLLISNPFALINEIYISIQHLNKYICLIHAFSCFKYFVNTKS